MKTKKLYLILLLALLLMVAGCKDGSDEPVTNQGTENDANNNTNNDINAGNDNGANNGNNIGQGNQGQNSQNQGQSNAENKNPEKDYLSSNELLWFTEVYFNDRNNNMVDRFLYCTYEDAGKIDYSLIFELGILGENDGFISDDEWKLIEERYPYTSSFLFMDWTKFTYEELENVVKEYVGLGIQQTSQIGLSDFIYLQEYNAYYKFNGDTFYDEIEFYSGWRNEDGTITLQYLNPTWEVPYDVILRPKEDGYFFVSNMQAEQIIAKEETGLDPHKIQVDYVKTTDADQEKMKAFCEQNTVSYSGVLTYYNFETGEAKFDLYKRFDVDDEEHPIGWEYIEVDEILLQMSEKCEVWFITGPEYSKIKLMDLEELVECGYMEMHVFELYIVDGKIYYFKEIMLP